MIKYLREMDQYQKQFIAIIISCLISLFLIFSFLSFLTKGFIYSIIVFFSLFSGSIFIIFSGMFTYFVIRKILDKV